MVYRAIALRTARHAARQLQAPARPARAQARQFEPILQRGISSTSRLFYAEQQQQTQPPPHNDAGNSQGSEAPGGQGSQGKEKKKEKEKPKGSTNAPPRSPWQVFIQTLKEEIEANKGWQENVKQLKGEVDKMADSAALKRGRDVYEKTRISNMIRDNPRIQSAARQLGKAGMSMSEATSRALQDSGVLSAINRVNGTLGFLGDQIADTAVYKSVAAGLELAVGDIPVADGYEAREARLKRREERRLKAGKSRRVKANPE